jgi:dUTP pyrophosphatase
VIDIVVSDDKLIPSVATEGSAGYDMKLSRDVVIRRGEIIKVSTGVSMEIPTGCVGLLAPRSSTGKLDLALANTIGFIDSDFRGEICVLIKNLGTETKVLYKYDKLFQLVIVPVLVEPLNKVKELSNTGRDLIGYGSTDKR